MTKNLLLYIPDVN